MNAPTPMVLSEVITTLRSLEAEQVNVPTAAQLRRVVTDLSNCVSLEDTAAAPELAGFAPDELLRIAEEFGKHRARVHKENLPKPAVVTADDTGMLFPITRQEQLAMAAKPRRRRRRVELPESLTGEIPGVILPRGYERTAEHGRDVSCSIRALIAAQVEDAEIIRFIARHFEPAQVTLSADHVHLLHWLTSRGLGSKLLELAGLDQDGGPTGAAGNRPLVKLMVQAYDLLEVARADAVDGLTALVVNDGLPAEQVARAARKARWLAAGELGRMEKLATEVVNTPGNTRLKAILDSRLASFAAAVKAAPGGYVITDVTQLNDAHLVQILASSGLLTDVAEDKALTSELRTRLTQLGMSQDLDREIPEGLRAFHAGRLEEFYASRQARVEGDPDWQLLYQAEPAQLVR